MGSNTALLMKPVKHRAQVNAADASYDSNYLENVGGEDDAYLTCGIKWDF